MNTAILTPRRRVEAALRGGRVDKVPFTVYAGMIPQGAAERVLRNRGLCIMRYVSTFHEHRPNVRVREETTYDDGRHLVRTYFETPAGTLSTLAEPVGFTTWYHERMFKRPEDYKALLAYIRDARYTPNEGDYAGVDRVCGEDFILRGGFGLEPLQSLISGTLMDSGVFCIEWMERRDEILRLYEALVEARRRVYPLVAQSPVLHANYGGNVVPEIIGLETFEQYYVPHYNEAAEIMHKHGKLIGCHYDANCRLLARAIAGTALDYIEAFTPAPDTDMTMAQARQAWPDKVLWLNYPSSVHLRPDAEIEATAYDLIRQAGRPDGVLIGITEDVPPDRWQASYRAIMDGLDRHAAEHRGLYAAAG
jgi:hypothetical protein